MSTDYRAELQRLLGAVENDVIDTNDGLRFQAAVNRARTTLSQPEPEVAGLSDEEVLDLADDCDLDRFEGERSYPGTGTVVKEGCWEAWDHQLIAFARAIQQRCATTQPEPEVDEGIDDLVAWLWSMRDLAGECNPDEQRRYGLAATLLGQKAAETTHWRPATPQPSPVPVAMSADTLAAIIREVDGTHRLGANALAEAILSHPGSRWSPTIEPEGVTDEAPEKDAPVWYNSDMASSWEAGRRDGWSDAIASYGTLAIELAPENVDELVSEKLPDLRQNLETVIRCSRAYDVYSTMTPIELADRIIDAVVSWHPSTLPHQRATLARPEPEGVTDEEIEREALKNADSDDEYRAFKSGAFFVQERISRPAIEPVPVSKAEIDELTWQHCSDLGDLRIGIAPEDVPALVAAVLTRYARPTIEPVPVAERSPEEMQRVHHCYEGVRDWCYGIYSEGKFYERAGPHSFPATHWHPALPVPGAEVG